MSINAVVSHLEISFNNFSTQFRIFMREKQNEDKPPFLDLTPDMKNAMTQFKNAVNKASVTEKESLLHKYEPEIYNICSQFNDLKKWDYVSYCDSVFYSKLNMKRHKDNDYINRLFIQVIEGITYFQKDKTMNRPAYHRLNSCGSRNADEYALSYTGMTAAKKRIHRKATEKCYIERLIYDKIFTNELYHTKSQNPEHIQRLDLVKKDYESCFPGYKLDVHIEFNNDTPHIITITKTNKHNIKTVETYIKTYLRPGNYNSYSKYHLTIDCYKTVSNLNKTYIKTQSFIKESRWRENIQNYSISNLIETSKEISLSSQNTI